jgi:hypothetical protein
MVSWRVVLPALSRPRRRTEYSVERGVGLIRVFEGGGWGRGGGGGGGADLLCWLRRGRALWLGGTWL